jgi:hypothetical protein
MSRATTASRVRLRPFAPDDAAAVQPWLAEAVAAQGALKPAAETPATLPALHAWAAARWPDGTLLAVEVDGLGAAGFVVWTDLPPLAGWNEPARVITALATRREARNFGYGAEVVYRLEEARPGVLWLAATPRFNGLSIYFWLRVGYRPVGVDLDATRATDPACFWLVRAASLTGSGVWAAR